MAAAKTKLLASRCDRCGARLREGRYVYSTWTKKRYCSDLDACGRRAKRKGVKA